MNIYTHTYTHTYIYIYIYIYIYKSKYQMEVPPVPLPSGSPVCSMTRAQLEVQRLVSGLAFRLALPSGSPVCSMTRAQLEVQRLGSVVVSVAFSQWCSQCKYVWKGGVGVTLGVGGLNLLDLQHEGFDDAMEDHACIGLGQRSGIDQCRFRFVQVQVSAVAQISLSSCGWKRQRQPSLGYCPQYSYENITHITQCAGHAACGSVRLN